MLQKHVTALRWCAFTVLLLWIRFHVFMGVTFPKHHDFRSSTCLWDGLVRMLCM
jgi:hypothetical protein